MTDLAAIENEAGIARVTCGWRLPGLALDNVRRYWRDVHSPAISRRLGIYDYRHMPFDPVQADLFAPVTGIGFSCDAGAQLQWLSDVRYRDDAALALFGTSPDGEVKAHLLADIDLIVDRSTTYRAVDENARTFLDTTGIAAPAGPSTLPRFGVFFRQRGEEAPFRVFMKALAARWAAAAGVRRVRLSLFDRPDMEAEKKAGYPIKTHPVEQQYQAWIDLAVDDVAQARTLFSAHADLDAAAHLTEVHAYPAPAMYCFVYGGKPTLLGLRGYAAVDAINGLNAARAREPSLLRWMYGDIVQDGPAA